MHLADGGDRLRRGDAHRLRRGLQQAVTTSRLIPLAAAALVLAGCGGGRSDLRTGDVAVVCGRHVTRASFDALMRQGRATYRLQKAAFPAAGTAKYDTIEQHVIGLLVEHAEFEHAAAQLGVVVSRAEIDAQVKQTLAGDFKGNVRAFHAELARQGMTERDLRQLFRSNILQRRLVDRLTSHVKVGNAAIRAYYRRNKSKYVTRPSRSVRQIVVGSHRLAMRLEAELAHGASFAALAKQYSTDRTTAAQGGRFDLGAGTAFTAVARVGQALPTGRISTPVHAHDAWYIVQALGPLHPAAATPLAQVRLPIAQYLLGQRRQQIVTAWLARLKATCAKDAAYRHGFAPAA